MEYAPDVTIMNVLRDGKTLADMVQECIESGSTVMTDEHPAYKSLKERGTITTIVTFQSNFRKKHSSKILQIYWSLTRGVNSLSWLIIRTKKGLNVKQDTSEWQGSSST
ncbi:MAG: transposase [Thaumarchaeota archaeon]|nr:transposase [Nitrososphaerota archaeon]